MDTVRTALTSYTLGENLEILEYTGFFSAILVGNDLQNVLIGGAGSDRLTGLLGNDTLDGGASVDRAIYSGRRSEYLVTIDGAGHRVTDLRPGASDGSDLLTSIELLVFADGEFALAPVPGADTDVRLVALDGFVGGVGGSGSVFGTNGFQDITVRETGTASLVFDGSFARGGDVIRLPGNAADYTIALSGSNALLVGDGVSVSIPVGTLGTPLVFADGVRLLVFDAGLGSVRIGAQAVSDPARITAAADGTVLPGGGDPAVAGRLVLMPDIGSEVNVSGRVNVFGTNDADRVTLDDGNFVLDGSFARGGDTIRLLDPATGFKAYISGSSVVLFSEGTSVTIPVGTIASTLSFAGALRDIRFDASAGVVTIGDQAITATSAENADALFGSSMMLGPENFA